MKKNKYILTLFAISFLLINFFSFGKVVKADDQCSSNSCYCTTDGSKCSLMRNPRGSYTEYSDMSRCGCVDSQAQQNTGSNNNTNTNTNIASNTSTKFEVCEKEGIVKAFQIIGYCLIFIKIAIPLLLIIFGSIELGKAVIASDDKAIKNAISSLVKRAIAGVIIFFIPYVISAVMSLVDDIDDLEEYNCLTICIKDPENCEIPPGELFGE